MRDCPHWTFTNFFLWPATIKGQKHIITLSNSILYYTNQWKCLYMVKKKSMEMFILIRNTKISTYFTSMIELDFIEKDIASNANGWNEYFWQTSIFFFTINQFKLSFDSSNKLSYLVSRVMTKLYYLTYIFLSYLMFKNFRIWRIVTNTPSNPKDMTFQLILLKLEC